jgi:DNA-directed RNA polymerase specialized sigma subunit
VKGNKSKKGRSKRKIIENNRSFSPYESLMSVMPFHEPGPSRLELLSLREIIADAMDSELKPIELWVFNAVYVERKSLRSIGRDLARSKSTVARIRDSARIKLQNELLKNPLIQDYLESQWNHS